jgi:outer membrane protein TolC
MKTARGLTLLFLLCAGSVWGQRAIGIEEAVEMALANSAELRISALRSQTAVKAFQLGIRDLLPQVGLSVSDAESVAMNAPDTTRKSWSVTVTQPVFDGGRFAVGRSLAQMGLAIEARKSLDAEDELADSVRGLYHKILVQREQLTIQKGIRDVTQRQLEISRTERGIGSIREIDLLDAELELGSIELTLQETEMALDESSFQFRRLLGLPADAAFELSGTIDEGYTGIDIPSSEDFFSAIGMENNAELARQNLEIRKSVEELKNADSWFIPNISLEVTLSVSGERYPLQSFSANGKLVVDFPIRAFPLSTSLSVGATPGSDSSGGATASIGILRDIGYVTDRSAGELAYRANVLKREELQENLRFQIVKSIAGHAQKQRGLALARRQIDLLGRKIAIMGRQLELGEVKRVDYMKLQTQLARDRTSLLQEVLHLLESERAFERLLGIDAGELEELCRQAAARSGK